MNKWYWLIWGKTDEFHKLIKEDHTPSQKDHEQYLCYSVFKCRDCKLIFRDYYHNRWDDEGSGAGIWGKCVIDKINNENMNVV